MKRINAKIKIKEASLEHLNGRHVNDTLSYLVRSRASTQRLFMRYKISHITVTPRYGGGAGPKYYFIES